MLRALCSVGRHADALTYLAGVPTKRQRTHMYTLLMRACNEAGALGVARECHDMFLRRRHTPDARLAAEVVMLLGRSGEVAAAEAAWRHALGAARGEEEHACLHAARAAALARAGQLPAAVAALEAILDRFADLLPVDASFSLDSGDSGGGDGDGDQQRWREQAAHPPPVRYMQHARNAVLAAAQAAGDAAAVRRVTGLATLRGLPPDLATYHSLLRAAIAHGDGLAAVQEGVEELRRLGMRPTRETYSILLRACAVEGDPQAAQAVFDGMPARGVSQTRVHHNALLHIYSHAGDLQGVDGAYRRMRAAGFAPDASTFQALLSSIKHWAALETAARVEGEGPAPQVERTMQRKAAGALLAGWVADLDAARPCQLTPALFTTLLHAYSQCGEIHSVLLLMRDACGCQLAPDTSRQLDAAPCGSSGSRGSGSSVAGRAAAADVPAANAAAGGGAGGEARVARSSGDGEAAPLAADVPPEGGGGTRSGAEAAGSSGGGGTAPRAGPLSQRTLQRAHLAPSLPVFNAAIGACTRVGRWHMADAVALLHSMMSAGLSPDVHTYTSLISGCAFGRQAALARELWRQMEERGIRPNIVTHNAMVKVELFTYGVDAGTAYLRRMVQQGLDPDRASWSTLLVAARLAKRGDVADMALQQLAGREEEEEAAAAEAARLEEAAAAVAAAAGVAVLDDHRWHGYYEQQEEEDEW
ncbi:hypothetical protein CHLNCDRAFT_54108 [Chlorella variabilis]|uniref:PROP1-like PPR domain-containing protein n=1 Tax=Chlorella variabilis TaxID=554065 RepID=E1ZMJ3_CHLVA|nr:hypothetical protein CHLNCDRAFT_54108 [Chlorella variabilis]EFN53008.1 hypothetical protein CHLNCDRAFT_54108 [Chlorella variabilis]|eukprot:XP_005845110.1 hypothetical protein CHLNCDRAFT_54108 [Chlorella variabilis]